MPRKAATHPTTDPSFDLALAWLNIDETSRAIRRRQGICLVFAIAFHAILALIVLPESQPLVVAEPEAREPIVIKKYQLQPPPPQAPPPPRPRRAETRPVPIPDPTPADPEPIVELAPVEPAELDWSDSEILVLDDAPAAPPAPPAPSGPLFVDGVDVTPPMLVDRVEPDYPVLPRRLRESGTVILQAIIEKDGSVSDVKALKETPINRGFASAAIEAVRQWRYEPALQQGKPVAVYFTVRCNFSLE